MHDERSRLELSYAQVVRLACDQMEQLDELRLALAETEARANKSDNLDRKHAIDTPKGRDHTNAMTDFSRDELKAHLENQDLKVDARLAKFEQRVADGLSEMNHSLQMLDKDLAGVRGLKGTIILNSVLSVIAVVGIVIAVMAYGVSNFDSGRDTSELLQEMRQQSFENKVMLEQIKANQSSPVK